MPTFVERISGLRRLILRVSRSLRWLPPLVARLTIGLIFVQTGWGKLQNLPNVIEYFRSLGIPAPEIQAPFAAFMEFACGALVLVGLLTRLASLPLIVIMLVALKTAKLPEITSLSEFLGTEEFLYIGLLLWLAAYGAGLLSLDRLLGKRLEEDVTAPSRGATRS